VRLGAWQRGKHHWRPAASSARTVAVKASKSVRSAERGVAARLADSALPGGQLLGRAASKIAEQASPSILTLVQPSMVVPSPTHCGGKVLTLTTFADKRKVTPEKTAKGFAKQFAGDDMTKALQSPCKDPEFPEWEGYRNVLAHRTQPPRIFSNGPGISKAEWKPVDTSTGQQQLEIDANTTATKRQWLSRTLATQLSEAEAFVRRHISRLPAVCQAKP
jgi:hypothetical protein